MTNPFAHLAFTSCVADLFDPALENVRALIGAVDSAMNSTTVLLKGQTNIAIDETTRRSIFSGLIRDAFVEMFLEFDRLSGLCNYHEWDKAGPHPWPEIARLIRPEVYHKLKPMSVLGFAERLHWMLRTALSPHHMHTDEPTARRLIQGFYTDLFGPAEWTVDSPLIAAAGLPKWIAHSWTFYDVVPDFLHSSGYWNEEEKAPENTPTYFDSGEADSCTFFFKDTVFYLLLTNGCP
jgi:hypothetical protein